MNGSYHKYSPCLCEAADVPSSAETVVTSRIRPQWKVPKHETEEYRRGLKRTPARVRCSVSMKCNVGAGSEQRIEACRSKQIAKCRELLISTEVFLSARDYHTVICTSCS